MEMSLANLRRMSEYRTPELNEVCYFHYKGFGVITEDIQAYKNCRCLWLEGNALECIENLDTLVDLRQLYLQENCIRDIGGGLRKLTNLVTLNLAQNFLENLEGLETLTQLKTLKVNGNRLCTIDKIRHLLDVPSLETVDLTDNKLADDSVMLDIFAKMPNLLSLYAHQNPFCSKIKPYRKLMLGNCTKLRYLDDKPVFDDERRAVTAYMTGGIEAERAERQAVKDEAKAKDDANRAAFRELVENAKREKAERDAKGIKPEPTAYFLANNNPTEEDRWFTAERERNRKRLQEANEMERAIDKRLAAQGHKVGVHAEATHEKYVANANKDNNNTAALAEIMADVDAGKEEEAPAPAAHVDPMAGVAAAAPTPMTAAAPAKAEEGGAKKADTSADAAAEEASSSSSYVDVAPTPDTASAVLLPSARTSAMSATPDCSAPEDSASSSGDNNDRGEDDAAEDAKKEGPADAGGLTGIATTTSTAPKDSRAHTSAALLPTSSLKTSAQHRPMIWGTPAYDKLWKQACAATDNVDNTEGAGDAHDDASASASGTDDGVVVEADTEPVMPAPAPAPVPAVVESPCAHEELD